MDIVIAYRVHGGAVQMVLTRDGDVAVFPHHDEAVAFADETRLFQSGQADYQIIELDEL